MDDVTPWEDINPTMALAQRPAPQSTCLAPWSPEERLRPATRDDFRRELTACYSLVAPATANTEARREWLTVAWGTLQGIPADLLERGCKVARERCDHPSKIVPTIMEEVRQQWQWRKEFAAKSDAPRLAAPKGEEPEYCTPEQAAAILEEYGLKSRFASNRSE